MALRLDDRILSLLTKAAENGDPCPKNQKMSLVCGGKPTTISKTMIRLEKRGLLTVERDSNRRRVVVGDKATGWSDVDRAAVFRRVRSVMVAKMEEKMEERRRDVLAILVKCAKNGIPAPSNAEIAAQKGWDKKTVTRALMGLEDSGRIIRFGSNQCRRYIIPEVGVVKPRRERFMSKPSFGKPNPHGRTFVSDTTQAMMPRARRVSSVSLPVGCSEEHAAMMARFIERGGLPLRCPDGFAVVRRLEEIVG